MMADRTVVHVLLLAVLTGAGCSSGGDDAGSDTNAPDAAVSEPDGTTVAPESSGPIQSADATGPDITSEQDESPAVIDQPSSGGTVPVPVEIRPPEVTTDPATPALPEPDDTSPEIIGEDPSDSPVDNTTGDPTVADAGSGSAGPAEETVSATPGELTNENTDEPPDESTAGNSGDPTGESTDGENAGQSAEPVAEITPGNPAGSTGAVTDAESGEADSENASPAPDSPAIVLADGPPLEAGSTIGRLTGTLRGIGIDLLLELNRSVTGGSALDASQAACISDYQPALGQALTSIDCGEAALSVVPDVRVSQVALVDTASCTAGLQSGDPSECRLARLHLEIPTSFVFPDFSSDSGGGFVPQRPQPVDGADVAFRESGLDQLIISNDSFSARGDYFCRVDLAAGVIADSGSPLVDCEQEISRVNERLLDLLDSGT